MQDKWGIIFCIAIAIALIAGIVTAVITIRPETDYSEGSDTEYVADINEEETSVERPSTEESVEEPSVKLQSESSDVTDYEEIAEDYDFLIGGDLYEEYVSYESAMEMNSGKLYLVTDSKLLTVSVDGISAQLQEEQVYGDLQIEYVSCGSDYDPSYGQDSYVYEIEDAREDQVIEFIHEEEADFFVAVKFAASKQLDEFKVKADAPGKIIYNPKGTLQTDYVNENQNEIWIKDLAPFKPWYAVNYDGYNSGITVKCSDTETRVIAQEEDQINILIDIIEREIEYDEIETGTSGAAIFFAGRETIVLECGDDVLGEETIGVDVHYIGNGGFDSGLKRFRMGSRIPKPNDPKREGYVFTGWYSDKECSILWDFEEDRVMEKTYLYAGWQKE